MECSLIKPKALREALTQKEKFAGEGMAIAGGQSLLVLLRNRLIRPKALIDLEGLGELKDIKQGARGLSIGAMTTMYSLLSSPEVEQVAPVLGQAASKVSSTPVRNMGTIGGNLCHNEIGADLPPSLLTLNAVAELKRRKDSRKVPLTEFFRDYFETVVEPDELLCRVEVPKPPKGAAGVYLKHAITSEDLAMVGVAAVVVPDGKRDRGASEVRIALGGVAPVPFRATGAEKAIKGAVLTDEAIREAGEIAATEAEPATDAHATADYRRKMIKVFVRRAIAGALEKIERRGDGKG